MTDGLATTCGSRMLANFVPPYDATSSHGSARPARCWSARPTWTSSRWARRPRSAFGPVPQSLGPRRACPAAARAARPRRSRPARSRRALGTDTGGSIRQPAASAASSGSSRPTAVSRATAWSRSRRASTRSARSPAPSRTARCCSRRSPATTRATRRRSTGRRDYARCCDAPRRRGGRWRACGSACRASTSADGLDAEVEAAVAPRIDDAARARRDDRSTSRCRTPAYAVRHLLRHRAGGGVEQPGPLRRRPLRPSRARRTTDLARPVPRRRAREGFGAEVQAAHHARHLRAVAPATTTRTT